mmetsp:Transcript_75573/g.245718  ORF Transcript_75573/g.245718 Transcript_75573/m.245718 type:complete len:209 (-) Transcript_75573:95-721(-)
MQCRRRRLRGRRRWRRRAAPRRRRRELIRCRRRRAARRRRRALIRRRRLRRRQRLGRSRLAPARAEVLDLPLRQPQQPVRGLQESTLLHADEALGASAPIHQEAAHALELQNYTRHAWLDAVVGGVGEEADLRLERTVFGEDILGIVPVVGLALKGARAPEHTRSGLGAAGAGPLARRHLRAGGLRRRRRRGRRRLCHRQRQRCLRRQ